MTDQSTALRRNILGPIVLSCAMLTAAIGLSVVTAPPAHADVYYSINMSKACKYSNDNDRFSYANTYNIFSASSWYCYHQRIGVPYEFWFQGGVDIQRYCSIEHPGTRAVNERRVSPYPAYAWACRM